MWKLLKVLGLVVLVTTVIITLLWWWFLRADSMEPPQLPGAVQTGILEHDGHRRSWLAYVPASKSANAALVLVLHGSMGTGEDMRVMTFYGFDVLAERDGFIAVYPDGYDRHWNDCRATASYVANTENIDDVGFLRALVQQMVEEQGVDPARVFATGLSNGGQMAYRLALEAPDLVTGVASVAASLPVDVNLDCEPSGTAVATMVMNGTADPVNPYTGGLVEILGDTSRGMVRSSAETAEYWAALAGYGGAGAQRAWPKRVAEDETSVTSTDWSAPGRVPVSLVTILGGGHTVPNPVFNLPRIIGATSHQLDGPGVIWTFFNGVHEALRDNDN